MKVLWIFLARRHLLLQHALQGKAVLISWTAIRSKKLCCRKLNLPFDLNELYSLIWEPQLDFTSQKLLYSYVELSKRDSVKCEHWGFPVEWEEQGSQKSKFLNKMTLLPHAEILYFNPQVYLWQTCVWKRPWSPAVLLQWFAHHNWNCLLHRSSGIPWFIFLRALKLNNRSPKTLDMQPHIHCLRRHKSLATFPNLSVFIYPSQLFVLHLKCCTVP